MFSDKHYVPTIKWRQGEYTALEALKPFHKSELTPLIEIPAVPWDYAKEKPAKSIDDHIDKIPEQMARAWGCERPIFIDAGLIDPSLRLSSGLHPLDSLFAALTTEGVLPVPVTATNRDQDYQDAVHAIAIRDSLGICIRAEADDFEDDESVEILTDLIDSFDIPRDQVDLIIDMKAIGDGQAGLTARLVSSILLMLGGATEYRTLTVLSGAFPVNLSSVPQGLSLLPRTDWAMWLNLRSQKLKRQPSYGDYTAAHPDPNEMDPRLMQVSASIRYAADTDWVIARGRSVNGAKFGGFGQFNALAAALIKHPEFTGASFSWSSDYIVACAGGGATGNLPIWRRVATNRHMSRTAHQIATLP